MKKVITVSINGTDELIRYWKASMKDGQPRYKVETTVLDVDSFFFWIDKGKATYLKTGIVQDEIKEKIISHIARKENK